MVDMSVLWLWWVAHHKNMPASWDTGRPFRSLGDQRTLDVPQALVETARQQSDHAFTFASALSMPSVNPALRLCNGMDVVNRTVFDHMHGWMMGKNFSLDLTGDGWPYLVDVSLRAGGKPESVEPEAAAALAKQRLRLINIHYQVMILICMMYYSHSQALPLINHA